MDLDQRVKNVESFAEQQAETNERFYKLHEEHQKNHEALAQRADRNFERLNESHEVVIGIVERHAELFKDHAQLIESVKEQSASMEVSVNNNTQVLKTLSSLIEGWNTAQAVAKAWVWLSGLAKTIVPFAAAAAIIYALWNGKFFQ